MTVRELGLERVLLCLDINLLGGGGRANVHANTQIRAIGVAQGTQKEDTQMTILCLWECSTTVQVRGTVL